MGIDRKGLLLLDGERNISALREFSLYETES